MEPDVNVTRTMHESFYCPHHPQTKSLSSHPSGILWNSGRGYHRPNPIPALSFINMAITGLKISTNRKASILTRPYFPTPYFSKLPTPAYGRSSTTSNHTIKNEITWSSHYNIKVLLHPAQSFIRMTSSFSSIRSFMTSSAAFFVQSFFWFKSRWVVVEKGREGRLEVEWRVRLACLDLDTKPAISMI